MKAIKKLPFDPFAPAGRIIDIDNTLKALQQAVGGHIETVTLRSRRDVCVLCDGEGLIHNLPYNCRVDGIDLIGIILAVGVDGDEFTDCPLTLEEWEGMLS